MRKLVLFLLSVACAARECNQDDVSRGTQPQSFDLSGCTELTLPGKELDAADARVLADALVTNEQVVTVNLDGNVLDLRALRGSEAVDDLDLSFKELCTASGIVIAKMLETNTALLILKCAKQTRRGHHLRLQTTRIVLAPCCAQPFWQ